VFKPLKSVYHFCIIFNFDCAGCPLLNWLYPPSGHPTITGPVIIATIDAIWTLYLLYLGFPVQVMPRFTKASFSFR